MYDDTQVAGRFQLKVHRKDNPQDKDWMSVTQITLFLDELKKYVKENLKIYTKENGMIDYLTLTDDSSIINRRNLRKVRDHSAALRTNSESSLERTGSLQTQSLNVNKHARNMVHNSTENQFKQVEQFEIVRLGTTYIVDVQVRSGVEGRNY